MLLLVGIHSISRPFGTAEKIGTQYEKVWRRNWEVENQGKRTYQSKYFFYLFDLLFKSFY